MKQILILGAGPMQVPAITEAKNLGLTTHVADANENAVGAKLADKFTKIDLKDKDSLLNYAKANNIDVVFTAGTDFSSVVAYLNNKLGLPSHSIESANNANFKDDMRLALTKAGVRCPNFVAVSGEWQDNLWDFTKPLNVVVKPADSMGGRGVIRVQDKTLLPKMVSKAREFSKSGVVIVEDFIGGREYSIDSLVFNGNVVICGIADRHIYYPPFFIEMGHTLPAKLTQTEEEELISIFKQGVKALGLTHGAAKGDMKIYNGKAYVGEIAARLSGGYMSGWTLPYANGINITKEAIRLAMGLTELDLTAKFNKYSSEKAFISIPGKIVAITGLDDAEKSEGIKNLFIRSKIGDEVDFPKNNVEKSGNVIAVANSRDEADTMANNSRKKIFIRLEKGNPKTRDFLFNQTTITAFNDGLDFNGLSLDEILTKYEQITAHNYLAYDKEDKEMFFKAIETGGLQGAIWFFDEKNSN